MSQAAAFQRARVAMRQFGVRQAQRLKLKAKSLSTAAEGQAEPTLLEHWHVDRGFWQGAAILTGMGLAGYLTPTDSQATALTSAVKAFRKAGVTQEHISDKQMMNDFFRRNLLAFYNVMMASPTFYFLWHLVHKAGVITSTVRSVTGSIRIVPFLGVLYGGCALTLPFGTHWMMNRGYSYPDASLYAAAGALFTGMAVLEALAELRGCGVTFAQMNAPALTCFSVALVGRLATGVLVQQQKIGKEFENALPQEWQRTEGWKSQVYRAFNACCIDRDFFGTLFGTAIFQHLLNSITYVLLTRGKATTLAQIGAYLTGGLDGSKLSALHQFGKTVALRLGFCGFWNWMSAQTPPRFLAIEVAAQRMEVEQALATE